MQSLRQEPTFKVQHRSCCLLTLEFSQRMATGLPQKSLESDSNGTRKLRETGTKPFSPRKPADSRKKSSNFWKRSLEMTNLLSLIGIFILVGIFGCSLPRPTPPIPSDNSWRRAWAQGYMLEWVCRNYYSCSRRQRARRRQHSRTK